jgi:chitin synthase
VFTTGELISPSSLECSSLTLEHPFACRNVLDFSLLQWLDTSQVAFPALFDEIKFGNSAYRGRDITALMASSGQRDIADCMVDVLRVGFVTNASVGCITSSIVLYVSLTVIIGVVVIRFIMAVLFGWFLSWRIGTYKDETYQQRRDRAREIEDWTDDIYRPAPARYRPNVKAQKKSMLPKTSRFTKGGDGTGSAPSLGATGSTRPESKYGEYRKSGNFGSKSMLGPGMKNSPPGSPMGGYKTSRSSASLPGSTYNVSRIPSSFAPAPLLTLFQIL